VRSPDAWTVPLHRDEPSPAHIRFWLPVPCAGFPWRYYARCPASPPPRSLRPDGDCCSAPVDRLHAVRHLPTSHATSPFSWTSTERSPATTPSACRQQDQRQSRLALSSPPRLCVQR